METPETHSHPDNCSVCTGYEVPAEYRALDIIDEALADQQDGPFGDPNKSWPVDDADVTGVADERPNGQQDGDGDV